MSLLNKRITIFLPILLAAIQLWSNNETDASEINLQSKDFNTHTASIQGELNFYWQKFYTADQINQQQTEAIEIRSAKGSSFKNRRTEIKITSF